jgi:hypothetical protein
MAQNTFPSGVHDLMQLAETMAHGLETHGPWLRMTQTDPAEFRSALDVLREREAEFARIRSEKTAARSWMDAVDDALTDWLAKARLAVMLARGMQWSEAWIEAGFTRRATTVPKAIGPRVELARRVVDFFARNPQFGVAHASITASHGRKLYDAIIGAQQLRRQLMIECNHAKTARGAAERKLQRKMRQVVVVLSVSIKTSDPRWVAFGLNQPRGRGSKRSGLAATPAAPITRLSPPGEEGAGAAGAAA